MRAVHVSVSPPPDAVTSPVDLGPAAETARQIAAQHGVRCGVVVCHGFRATDGGQRAFERAVDRGAWDDEDGDFWWWVRNRSDWRSQVEWSPHFHVLGLATDVRSNNPDADDGWVCHRLRSLTPFYPDNRESYDDMICVAKHLYTHATFLPGARLPTTAYFATDAAAPDQAPLVAPVSQIPFDALLPADVAAYDDCPAVTREQEVSLSKTLQSVTV